MKTEHSLSEKQIKLLKAVGLLLLVIVFFAFLSKTMLSGGQTLSEYAEQNAAVTATSEAAP